MIVPRDFGQSVKPLFMSYRHVFEINYYYPTQDFSESEIVQNTIYILNDFM